MSARAHLRPVGTAAPCGHQTRNGDQVLICCYGTGHDGAHEHDPAPQPEPIAEERIEWAHVLGDFPGREKYGDRDEIHHCWDLDTRAPRTTPCDRTTINGFPIRHVWRRVVTTTYQGGQP